jgi:hypothetical protein
LTHDLRTRGEVTTVAKYVVLFHDGIHPAFEQDPPADDIRAGSLDEVREVFERIARATLRDGVPTDEGGPWADVYREQDWDGISYGDCPAYRVTVTARGAVRVDRWS